MENLKKGKVGRGWGAKSFERRKPPLKAFPERGSI
jgi:hypothetical protein